MRRGRTLREGKRKQGKDHTHIECAGRAQWKGGTPLYGSVCSHRMACPSERKGTPKARRKGRTGRPPSSVRSQRTAGRNGGEPRTPQTPKGDPPSSVRSQRTTCRDREERGRADSIPKERGANPRAGAQALRARPDKGDGGKHPRPENAPPPTARQSEGEGAQDKSMGGPGPGEEVGSPSPLEGRGAPEEQAWAIVARIMN